MRPKTCLLYTSGTGMSILLMVVQSWEEESRRIRGKDIVPCRLLFLDEAARLDGDVYKRQVAPNPITVAFEVDVSVIL